MYENVYFILFTSTKCISIIIVQFDQICILNLYIAYKATISATHYIQLQIFYAEDILFIILEILRLTLFYSVQMNVRNCMSKVSNLNWISYNTLLICIVKSRSRERLSSEVCIG